MYREAEPTGTCIGTYQVGMGLIDTLHEYNYYVQFTRKERNLALLLRAEKT